MVINGIVSHQCGEQGLPAWGVCNLGAINLAKFYDEKTQDVKWDDLDKTARYSTRFLDNVIDSTPYFFEQNEQQQLGERRVGLNNMGLAELMIKLGIRYGSDESVAFIDKLYGFLARAIYETSIELAQEKGSFPKFEAEKFLQSGYMQSMPEDIREKVRKHGIRNVTLTDTSANRDNRDDGEYLHGNRTVLLVGVLPQEPPGAARGTSAAGGGVARGEPWCRRPAGLLRDGDGTQPGRSY